MIKQDVAHSIDLSSCLEKLNQVMAKMAAEHTVVYMLYLFKILIPEDFLYGKNIRDCC